MCLAMNAHIATTTCPMAIAVAKINDRVVPGNSVREALNQSTRLS